MRKDYLFGSLKAHFDRIGVDLSEVGRGFRYYPETRSYRIKESRARIVGLVCYDPAVEYVLQNTEFDIGFEGVQRHAKRSVLFEDRAISPVQKRWMPWSARMLTLDHPVLDSSPWDLGVCRHQC